MTGINHALTGGVIAAVVGNPVIALPLAFVSHFALDSLPHFGEVFEKRKRLTKSVWAVDVILTMTFLGFLIATGRWVIVLGAIAGISPDFAWIYRFIIQENFGAQPPQTEGRFNRMHNAVQRYESRLGLVVDILWLCFILTVLSQLL